MPTGSFEKNNWGWQLGQLQQRVGEWWELQTSRFSPDIPNTSVPSWLTSPLLGMVVKAVFWVILAFLVCWAALRMMRLLSPYFYSLRNQLNQSVEKATKASISELSVADWLQRSQ